MIRLDGTNGITPASWTTATRPTNPSVGQSGFNTTLSSDEYWDGAAWVSDKYVRSYLKASANAAQTFIAAGVAVNFQAVDLSLGSKITITGNNTISVDANTAVELVGYPGIFFGESAGALSKWQWYDVGAAAYVGLATNLNAPTSTAWDCYPSAGAIHAAKSTTAKQYQLRCVSATGGSRINVGSAETMMSTFIAREV